MAIQVFVKGLDVKYLFGAVRLPRNHSYLIYFHTCSMYNVHVSKQAFKMKL